MGAIELVEKSQLAERPAMKSGDTVRVHVKVREGDKERIQIFEGVVIGLHRGGTRASFTVRKVSFGQGVERIFPLHSPTIQKVEVMRSAKVRRAKLYYLRDLKGKAARMKDAAKSKAKRQKSPYCYLLGFQLLSSMVRVPAMRTLENALRRVGFVHVAGVDEVGRGCLAGPGRRGRRRAASRPAHSRRLRFEGWCRRPSASGSTSASCARAIAWAVAAADPTEIDRINIHQASLRAMQRAVLALAPLPDIVLVDAFRVPGSADGAARRPARRPPLLGDCRGVDRRQGDARSSDARAARPRSALRLRSPQGLRDGRSSRRRCAFRLLRCAPPIVPARDAV